MCNYREFSSYIERGYTYFLATDWRGFLGNELLSDVTLKVICYIYIVCTSYICMCNYREILSYIERGYTYFLATDWRRFLGNELLSDVTHELS